MIWAKPGGKYTTVLDAGVAGLVGIVTVQLERPNGTTVTPPTVKGIVEVEPEIYAKEDNLAPKTAGTYIVVWDNEGERAAEELIVTYDLPVTGALTPLSPNALVSVDEARTYLQVGSADKPTDQLLEQVIGGLSLRILQHTGRTYINLEEGDKATARSYLFDPSERTLHIDDCRGITLVEATATPQNDTSWEEVDDELWFAEPLGEEVVNALRFLAPASLPAIGTGWSLLGLHASRYSAPYEQTPWPHQVRAELSARAGLRITAKWGYGPDLTTVPDNVKLALLMWLQNIHKRDQAFFGEQAKVTAKIAMPEDVREMLDGEAASEATVTAI